MKTFKLAHLSDIHLPLPDGVKFSELIGKRITGFLSWHVSRKNIHMQQICDLIREDIQKATPNHVALTGDLVNISATCEFSRAFSWLKEFGSGEWISFTPGNHDCYVKRDNTTGLDLFRDYCPKETCEREKPHVRYRGNIALITLSSGLPTFPFQASGKLGEKQLEALPTILTNTHQKGFFRVVLIHHPPLPGQNSKRKGLKDAKELTKILQTSGAELVLHGHNHRHMHETISSPTGPVHILGTPSASAAPSYKYPSPAAWYLYEIARQQKNWQVSLTKNCYDHTQKKFIPQPKETLSY